MLATTIRLWRGALALVLLTAAACGPPGVQVRYESDPHRDFRSLHTYAWAEQPLPGDTTLRSEDLAERVRAAVDPVLAEKGLEPTDPKNADVKVYWYAAVHQKAELRKLDYTQSAPLPERTVDVFAQGTLVIDLVDRARNTLLWRARAQARLVPNASKQDRTERIRAAVEQMFEGYPPH